MGGGGRCFGSQKGSGETVCKRTGDRGCEEEREDGGCLAGELEILFLWSYTGWKLTHADNQVYGFCHGVINTDNISLLGLTIDYGPWAFMEAYDPYFICNSSDHEARYDYRKQPTMVLYAIRALAGSLAELVGYEEDHVACVGEGWSEGVDVETMDRWRDSGELFSSEVEKNFMEVFKEEYARLYAEVRRRGPIFLRFLHTDLV